MKTVNTRQAKKIFEAWNPSTTQKIEQYCRIFPEQYAKLADSPRAKIKGLNESDLYTLGRAMEQQAVRQSMNEEQTFAQLGASPTLGFDFITAIFGESVIPYIASEQVIDEIQGLVYFENIVAQGVKRHVVTASDEETVDVQTIFEGRGNVEPGDTLAKAAGAPKVYPQGYAGEMVYGEQLTGTDATDGETTEFELTLANAPIRQNYVKIITKVTNSAGTVVPCVGFDDGKGNIIGGGIVGTIDYASGAVTLTYTNAPVSGEAIIANYATNFELTELPAINTMLSSKFVKANVYGLQTDTSILSSYQMAKRFEFDMQQRAVQILQEQILNEITTELLAKIAIAYAEGGEIDTVFDTTVPTGVSQQAHFNSVDYVFGIVAQKMQRRAGKGTLSVALAGPTACAFLAQNAKFERIGEVTSWATVYGVYDNTTIVIRCPQLAQFDAANGDKTIYFLYKGNSQFDAAAVYAPYMPLVGVNDLPVPTALLNRRSAVASMAAVDVLVPGYIQKFVLTKSA